MSQTKVQLVSNISGNVSGGASFTGIITATEYDIAGSTNTLNASGLSVGVATATTLKVGTGVTISGGIVTATSFVGDGSGLQNAGSSLSAGSGSQRVVLTSLTTGTMTTAATNANLLFNSTSGVLTATTFSGNITGTAATFTGNVSIAGTLTYEDVTNVDSVGLITARSGIVISGGGGINITGGSGIITATSYRGDGSQLTGVSAGLSLRQAGSVIAGGAATTVNFASGATITSVSAGIATITIAAGIQTEALNSIRYYHNIKFKHSTRP
jgi:hypothetical protein